MEKNVEHFLVWLSSNVSIQTSLTAEIIGIHFIGILVPIEYMPTISAVGFFSPNERMVNMSNLTKPYFRIINENI